MEVDDEGWIARLMRKLACEHKWEKLSSTDFGPEGRIRGRLVLYTCKSCGKLWEHKLGNTH